MKNSVFEIPYTNWINRKKSKNTPFKEDNFNFYIKTLSRDRSIKALANRLNGNRNDSNLKWKSSFEVTMRLLE